MARRILKQPNTSQNAEKSVVANLTNVTNSLQEKQEFLSKKLKQLEKDVSNEQNLAVELATSNKNAKKLLAERQKEIASLDVELNTKQARNNKFEATLKDKIDAQSVLIKNALKVLAVQESAIKSSIVTLTAENKVLSDKNKGLVAGNATLKKINSLAEKERDRLTQLVETSNDTLSKNRASITKQNKQIEENAKTIELQNKQILEKENEKKRLSKENKELESLNKELKLKNKATEDATLQVQGKLDGLEKTIMEINDRKNKYDEIARQLDAKAKRLGVHIKID